MSKEYLLLSEIAPDIPGAPSVNTVWTWCRAGLKSRNGERIRLAHIRIGKRLMTSMEDVEVFLKAIHDNDVAFFAQRDEAGAPTAQVLPERTAAQRSKDAEAAHARLAAAGM